MCYFIKRISRLVVVVHLMILMIDIVLGAKGAHLVERLTCKHGAQVESEFESQQGGIFPLESTCEQTSIHERGNSLYSWLEQLKAV